MKIGALNALDTCIGRLQRFWEALLIE